MNMKDADTIETLNDLIKTSKDGEYGFAASAEHLRDPALRSLFEARSRECADAAMELQACVRRLGGDAEDGGSASATLHRGWVAMKSTLAGYTDLAILEECERGEDVALARYRDALKQPLPADVLEIVRHQQEGAQRNHDQIRDLRNEARAMAKA
jgi:uncharacterized protein (TIGR02284 family)